MFARPVLCSSIPLASGVVPDWVHLLPAGEVRTIDGRGPYRVNDAQALMAASVALGKLPLDENHATDLAAPKGGAAPARGWIVELQHRADGIWGRVEWTGSGRRIMADKEYKGVSPVIAHRKDGSITAILRASLTNTPNLAGLATLHSQQHVALDASERHIIALMGIDPVGYARHKQSLAIEAEAVSGHSACLRSDGLTEIDDHVIRALGVDRVTYLASRTRQS